MALSVVFVIEWTDYRLKWDPTEFNNIDELMEDGELLWQPELVLAAR